MTTNLWVEQVSEIASLQFIVDLNSCYSVVKCN